MHLFLEGILGDRGKKWTDFWCPFMLCPSNQPVEHAKKPRMKFIQKIAPRVYQYRCLHCGCLLNKGLDSEAVPADMLSWTINPSLVGNAPLFEFNRW